MRRTRLLKFLFPLLFSAALAFGWSALPPQLARGPYLQGLHETGTQIVFRTPAIQSAILRYGPLAGPPWEGQLNSPAGETHVLQLADLLPDSLYHYEIVVNGALITDPSECFFRTAPPPNARRPFRFLAFGDSGTGNVLQLEVAQRMEEAFPWPDFALGLGDLIYPNGESENFDPHFFQPYARLLSSMPTWVTIGNHDAATLGGAPFLEAFSMPTNSGAPGHPSNTELYYSFDYGMAHFTCVDSQVSSHAVNGAMYRWIQDDLDDASARGKRWKVVFMHHPPYTKGTHDSEVELQLIQLRQDLVPLFESRGVDLVLAGHSHVYERSFLAQADAVLQNDPGTYTKYGSPDGTIYLVNGCGGQSGSGPLNHPLMARSLGNVEGFSVLDVSHDEIQGQFVQRNGAATDIFTLRKDPDFRPARVAGARSFGPSEVRLTHAEPVLGGAGTHGAEAPANYQITPAIPILSATLLSDQRTVALTLGQSPSRAACELTVLRTEDRSGNRGAATTHFVTPSIGGPGPNPPPVAVLEVDRSSARVPALVRFDAQRSFDVDGPLAATFWDFGDGSPLALGRVVEHLYSEEGLFTATLAVRDSSGQDTLATQQIRIHSEGTRPQVALVASTSMVMRGENVDFQATGSFDPDGGPLYLHWDFDDPSSGLADHDTGPVVSHGFLAAGTHVVKLTVMDDEGSTEIETVTVEVQGTDSSSSGGACRAAFTENSPWGGDPSLLLYLAPVLLLLWRWAARGAAATRCSL